MMTTATTTMATTANDDDNSFSFVDLPFEFLVLRVEKVVVIREIMRLFGSARRSLRQNSTENVVILDGGFGSWVLELYVASQIGWR
jgi:rhodanese-related sulfurtransferase